LGGGGLRLLLGAEQNLAAQRRIWKISEAATLFLQDDCRERSPVNDSLAQPLNRPVPLDFQRKRVATEFTTRFWRSTGWHSQRAG
jgi:hypothetical protein